MNQGQTVVDVYELWVRGHLPESPHLLEHAFVIIEVDWFFRAHA